MKTRTGVYISAVIICGALAVHGRPPYTLGQVASYTDASYVQKAKEMLATGKYDTQLNGALQAAARWSTLEMVKTLVEAGAEVNPGPGRDTPLHQVAASDEEDAPAIAKYLIRAGAEVDATNAYGATPLYEACEGSPDVAILLLDHGADPNRGGVRKGGYVETPLLRAASKGQDRTMVRLVDRGADVDVKEHNGINTPLHYAALGYVNATRALIQAGAEIDAVNARGETPLHRAARLLLPMEGRDAVGSARLLLEAGANPHKTDGAGDTVFDICRDSLRNWQGDTFNIVGGQGLSDGQFEALKKWRQGMPELLERAKKEGGRELASEPNATATTTVVAGNIANTPHTTHVNAQHETVAQEQEPASESPAASNTGRLPLAAGIGVALLIAIGALACFRRRK